MDDVVDRVSGEHLVSLLPWEHQLWLTLAGATIDHALKGRGTVARVELRAKYTPLLFIDFPGKQSQIPLDRLASGSFTVELSRSSYEQLLSEQDAIRLAKLEEDLRMTHLREQRDAERVARQEQERIAAAEALAATEREYADRRRILLGSLSTRHRERIEQLGLEYRGTRKSSRVRSRRITHCWACKEGLDNAVDVECVTCGWILCMCGACGCGYDAAV